MTQIPLSISEEFLAEIDEAIEPESSRSEWLREASREKLDADTSDEIQE